MDTKKAEHKKLVIILIALCTFTNYCTAAITVALDGTGDFGTIQATIDASVDGDVITVADGVYTGPGNYNINFKGKKITLQSKNGPEKCIIDCKQQGRGFIFESAETHNSVLDGFTITNARLAASWRNAYGGGIYCYQSSPAIFNCNLINNVVVNTLDDGSCEEEPLYVAAGGGMYVKDAEPIVVNCIFADNRSAGWCAYVYGEGVYSWSGLTLLNCTFYNNSVELGSAMVKNCIFWYSPRRWGWDLNKASFNLFHGADGTNGNIYADPLFADPENGDFHLKSQYGRWQPAQLQQDPNNGKWVYDDVTSPCIDAGDPDSDWHAELYPHGRRSNMGAYTNTPQASMSPSDIGNIADLNHDEKVTMQDFAALANKWQLDQILLAPDMDRNGKMDIQDLAILANNWLKK